jgi:hypothetical protein
VGSFAWLVVERFSAACSIEDRAKALYYERLKRSTTSGRRGHKNSRYMRIVSHFRLR